MWQELNLASDADSDSDFISLLFHGEETKQRTPQTVTHTKSKRMKSSKMSTTTYHLLKLYFIFHSVWYNCCCNVRAIVSVPVCAAFVVYCLS